MARLGLYEEAVPAPEEPGRQPAYAWSTPLALWPGVHLRLHVSLAVALAVGAIACLNSAGPLGWLALATYLLSLLIHEASHLLAASRVTARAEADPITDPVVLGPLGGLRVAMLPADARERVFVAMAGPMANLALVVGALFVLALRELPNDGPLLAGVTSEAYAVLIDGQIPDDPPIVTLAHLLVALNLPLFLINLAPATPFDGSEAMRSFLRVWLGPSMAREATFFVALLLGASLLGAACALVLATDTSPLLPVLLATVAVMIAYGAWYDASTTDYAAADSIGHFAADDDLIRQLLEPPPHEGRERADLDMDEPEPEPWDEEQVDVILAKVHAGGMTELTANERAILQRASERYRRQRRG